MPHVTFIHGILNKPPREKLLRLWLDALARGAGLDLQAESVTCSMVYWADVLYANTSREAEVERPQLVRAEHVESRPVSTTQLSRQQEIFVARLAAKFQAVAGGLDRDIPMEEVQTEHGVERVPLPWFIKSRIMEAYLRDVHHYLFNVEYSPRTGVTYRVQDEIRLRFCQALQQVPRQTAPHVVLGHSMGTVIAYDCLKRVPECPSVDALMTVGSPLGLDEIQDRLRPGWTREDGFPSQRVNDSWVNIFDRLDPVAGFDPHLANDYRRRGDLFVQDVNEPNYGSWRHDITKYLQGRRLRGALRRLLRA